MKSQRPGIVSFMIMLGVCVSLTSVKAQNYGWQKLNGPYGNNVIKIFTAGSSDVYVGTLSQGTGISTDMGKSWKMLPDSIPTFTAGFLTSKGTILAMGFDSLYRSTDNGKTWKGIQIGDSSMLLGGTSFAEDTDNNKVYLSTNVDLYVSDDDGQTWLKTGLSDAVGKISSTAQGKLVAITDFAYTGFFNLPIGPAAVEISDDGGMSWTKKDLPGNNGAYDLEIADNGDWYIPINKQGIYESSDEGDTWTLLNSPHKNVTTAEFDGNGHLLVGYDSGMTKYDLSSHTFQETNLPSVAVSDIKIAQDGAILVGSSDFFQTGRADAVFRSDDGGSTWKMVGASTISPMSMTVNNRGDLYVGGTLFGLFNSNNGGDSWNRLFTGSDNFVVIKSVVSGPKGYMLLSSYNNQSIYYSSDYGQSWKAATINTSSSQIIVTDYMYLDDKNVWAVANDMLSNGEGGIYASADTGKTWDLLGLQGKNILCMAHTNSANFVGTGDALYKTTDNGATWTDITDNLTISSDLLPTVVSKLFATKDGTLLATTTWGIQRSTDGGATWNIIKDITVKEYPSTVADEIGFNSVAQNSKGELFAGTGQNGILYSNDDGQSWTSINSGYASKQGDYLGPIVKLTVDNNDNVYAASSTGGVYKAVYHDTPIEHQPATRPVAIELGQNYPNPFNPTTNIPVKLAKTGKVRLTIYDILGRHVATLVDGTMRAGNHQVTFNASNLASGVYFYRLEANGKTMSRKMLLLK